MKKIKRRFLLKPWKTLILTAVAGLLLNVVIGAFKNQAIILGIVSLIIVLALIYWVYWIFQNTKF